MTPLGWTSARAMRPLELTLNSGLQPYFCYHVFISSKIDTFGGFLIVKMLRGLSMNTSFRFILARSLDSFSPVILLT